MSAEFSIFTPEGHYTNCSFAASIQGPKAEFYQKCEAVLRDWSSGKATFERFSSGSTGKPKAFSFTRKQILHSVRQTANAFDLKKGMGNIICLSPDYIAGFMQLMRSAILGMPMYLCPPEELDLTKLPEAFQADFMAVVPMQLIKILADDEQRAVLQKMQKIIIGGTPVSESLRQNLEWEEKPLYYETYGMTETLTQVAVRNINGEGVSEYFRPLPGVGLKLDERNCLVIDYPALLDEPLVTNDLVYLNADQTFLLVGRADRTINSGGIKVQAEAVEEAVGNYFQKVEVSIPFFIHAIPDEVLGEKVVLVLEKAWDKEDELRKQVQQALRTPVPFPTEILQKTPFSYTQSGKIDREATLA